MGLFPEFRGVEQLRLRRAAAAEDGARRVMDFACALVLGAAGSLGPIPGPPSRGDLSPSPISRMRSAMPS